MSIRFFMLTGAFISPLFCHKRSFWNIFCLLGTKWLRKMDKDGILESKGGNRVLISCCEKMIGYLTKYTNLSQSRKCWYVYALYKRILMILTMSCMIFLGCFVSQPYQVLCFWAAILSLRKYLSGYHAKTPLRCLCISIAVTFLSLIIIDYFVQHKMTLCIWLLLTVLSIATFLARPYNHPKCFLEIEEIVAQWKRAKQILVGQLVFTALLHVIATYSNAALYCAMGIIISLISFFVAKCNVRM